MVVVIHRACQRINGRNRFSDSGLLFRQECPNLFVGHVILDEFFTNLCQRSGPLWPERSARHTQAKINLASQYRARELLLTYHWLLLPQPTRDLPLHGFFQLRKGWEFAADRGARAMLAHEI